MRVERPSPRMWSSDTSTSFSTHVEKGDRREAMVDEGDGRRGLDPLGDCTPHPPLPYCGAMTIDLKSHEDVERWLNAIPDEARRRKAAVELSTRAALRVVPTYINAGFELFLITLSGLRCVAISWVIAQYSNHGAKLREAASEATEAAIVAYDAGNTAAVLAGTSAFIEDCDGLLVASRSALATFYFGVTRIGHLIESADHAGGNSYEIWPASTNDAKAIGQMGEGSCLSLPLWPEPLDQPGSNQYWRNLEHLKKLLIHKNQDWDVWFEWYEAVSLGHTPWPEAAAIEIVTLENEIWKLGPAVVNKMIKEILARHRTVEDDLIKSLPPPFELAPQFGIGPQGKIVLEPECPSTGDPTQDEDMAAVYAELRTKSAEFVALGQNTLGELATEAVRLRDRLPEDMGRANIYLIRSSTSSFRIKLKLHEDQLAKTDRDRNLAVSLDPTCSAYLKGLVEQLNIFMFMDARGRELDKISRGPEEFSRVVEQLQQVAPAITHVYNVADGAAVQIIQENYATAVNAPPNIHGAQAVDQGVKTTSNFFVRLLRWTLEKAAGGVIGKVLGEIYGPPIVIYVTTYAPLIKQFLMSVYNNPAVQRVLDLILNGIS